MAVLLDTETDSGLTAPSAYWRLNNFEQLANRQPDGTYSVPAIARFRAYASQDAFVIGKSFLAELLVSFTPSDAGANLAEEAYTALKSYDFAAEMTAHIEDLNAKIADLDARIALLPVPKDDDQTPPAVAQREDIARLSAIRASFEAALPALQSTQTKQQALSTAFAGAADA